MDEDRLGQFENQIAPADSETPPPRFERSLSLNRPNVDRVANDNECPSVSERKAQWSFGVPGKRKRAGRSPPSFQFDEGLAHCGDGTLRGQRAAEVPVAPVVRDKAVATDMESVGLRLARSLTC